MPLRIANRVVADEYAAVSASIDALYGQPPELPADYQTTGMARLRRPGIRRFRHPAGAGAAGWGMGLLDWDHDAYYHRLLMRQLPSPCTRVLDVGCGAGAFAAELARRVEHVDALDRSPAMIEAARQMTPANVMCILGDVMRDRSRLTGTTRSCRSPRCITCPSTTRCGACPAPCDPAASWPPGPAPARPGAGAACRASRRDRSPGIRRHLRRPQSVRPWRLVPAGVRSRDDAEGP